MPIKNAECIITARSSMSIWTLTYGHTGREVRGDAGYSLAVEWAKLQTCAELLNHPACEEFCSLVPSAPRLPDTALVFFRGRGVTSVPPRVDQMGPPPLNRVPAAGRYNRPGKRVLYLSDSEEGVLRELSAWLVEGVPYVQRYRLPLDKLNIADFAVIPDDHFVTAAFSKAEECYVDGRGPSNYIFSQLLAELVMAQFDGMRIPGVRGKPGSWYSNVVIFQPYPNWHDWLEQGSTPYRLSVPFQGGNGGKAVLKRGESRGV